MASPKPQRNTANSVGDARAGGASSDAMLDVEGLHTFFFTDAGIVRAVDGVSFHVDAGETLGIVGESGSGKSVTASSIMRLVAPPGRVVGGKIKLNGRDVMAMSDAEIRSLRGGSMAMIFQDPMTSLNPVLRISRQLEEAMLVHGRYDRPTAARRAIDLLGKMGITAPARAVRDYPHQFSGGMRQRVMLAMGFGNDPSLLIADEPTTALDVTVQAQILDLLRELNRDFGVAIILISHDLGVVANICSRVAVMYAGQIVEDGPTEEILRNPQHPYTWALLNAVPRLDASGEARLLAIPGFPPDLLDPPTGCRFMARCPFRIDKCAEPPPLIELAPGRHAACWVTAGGKQLPVIGAADAAALWGESNGRPQGEIAAVTTAENIDEQAVGGAERAPAADTPVEAPIALELVGLRKLFPIERGGLRGQARYVRAVDGVDLVVKQGETMGLVGESGSGKSTLARLVVRLYRVTEGKVIYEGRDITHLKEGAMRPLRRRLQMIFQDPYSSLNPRMTVGGIISEPLKVHHLVKDRAAARERVAELLSLVGMDKDAAARYPYEFSGGQRQRIGIARALAVEPDFVVADEPVSSLDVNIQAQVINLLEDLQDELKLTYLFIAHDLSVVRHVSDRIAVMYLGKIVEIGTSTAVATLPMHPYTKALISAAPVPDAIVERSRERIHLQGEIPSPIDPPSGCRFRTRCPLTRELGNPAICSSEEPQLSEHRPGHLAACHFPEHL